MWNRSVIQGLITVGLVLPTGGGFAAEVTLGLGYDRARSGHGFELHKFDDIWELYFYTYDANGHPEWFLGLAEMNGGIVVGDLQRYTWDETQSPSSRRDTGFDGEFRLDFTEGLNSPACDDGIARDDAEQVASFYWRVGDASDTWCTELLRVGDRPATGDYYGGVWYGGSGDSGYGFTMSHMATTVSALVYYYDADGNPRWALGTAPEDASAVQLTHFNGFCRECTPVPIEPFPAGTLALDWAVGSAPGSGDDRAELDLVYPESPFGSFLRRFTLSRLSDGDRVGEYALQYRLRSDTRYVAAWQSDDGDSNDEQVVTSRTFGIGATEQVANTFMPGPQANPVIGVADDGSYVVAWEDDTDENGAYQVHARGFYADGSERFGTITVNSEGDGQQRYPDIGVASNGDFVVAWEDDSDGNFFGQILGRGFYADGREKFADITINSAGAGHQMDPAIAMSDDGEFVVAWADDQNANELYDIAARGFHANGAERFAQFQVNAEGAGHQAQPDVAMTSGGDFVVVWVDDQDLNHYHQVVGRSFFAGGRARSGDVTINQVGTASQYQPVVAIRDSGNYVAAWVDQGNRVAIRGLRSNGNPTFDERVLSRHGQSIHGNPSIAMAVDGGAVVAWEYLRGASDFSVLGALVSPTGEKVDEILVSSTTSGAQRVPSIAIR